MVGEGRPKLTPEEFERSSKQFLDESQAFDIWKEKRNKFQQGTLLTIRRHVRFAFYNIKTSFPKLYPEKVFTEAYLPFTARHFKLCLALTAMTICSGVILYGRKKPNPRT